MLLETALKIGEARIDRLALSLDTSESDKWACVLLMALMAQIGVASVHLNGARAQFAATMIVIGPIAAHGGPFQPPLSVSCEPIANLLDICAALLTLAGVGM
jgi:hypothetical protein